MHKPVDADIIASLTAILAGIAVENPIDGACLDSAPMVTKALTTQGFPARKVTIAGWMDTTETVLAFLHSATRFDGLILDGTARQFNPTLPTVWITSEHDYLQRLAIATQVEHTSILDQQ
ncbi:hypothetical protein [Nocardia neocaledoniensis]|uniref:hypothetical protein n=1 Tax=Nocardia neocaledoniensis TaxID=236511 RepID=UPI0024556368|nr:hypothetical protein [Nocardia neocaledoniensis]